MYRSNYHFLESINEWSYVTDATLMKPCSIKGKILIGYIYDISMALVFRSNISEFILKTE